MLRNTRCHVETPRRWFEDVRESGRTDITAAARLFRLYDEDGSIFPSLLREPNEGRRSSGSEMTLQSSLPRWEPAESYLDRDTGTSDADRL